jgi:glycerol-3-phosphate dehydrogenase
VLDEKIDVEMRGRLLGRYGTEAPEVLAVGNGLGAGRINGAPARWAELRWAARNEGVVHLDDLLLRRVRIGLLLEQGGIPLMQKIRSIVQPELGWDDATWAREESRYRDVWSKSYGTTFTG